ncbi:hypothetical protein V6B33_14120 [Mangrovibacillus sp. Mu-81]|uniref:hypothetical protein n=1 Tax=Mangrovibacillus sp. Mu-81 TaxID=3121478 RepID=UPI002FE459A9
MLIRQSGSLSCEMEVVPAVMEVDPFEMDVVPSVMEVDPFEMDVLPAEMEHIPAGLRDNSAKISINNAI